MCHRRGESRFIFLHGRRMTVCEIGGDDQRAGQTHWTPVALHGALPVIVQRPHPFRPFQPDATTGRIRAARCLSAPSQVPVTGVDLAHKVILLEDGGRAGPFDLICACDGKRSRLRDSAAAQDPRLTVTARDGRAGEKLYKTFHVDDPGAVLEDGWLYMLGPPPHAVLARVPGGGGLGILPVPDRAARLPALRDRLPAIAPAISAAEAAAFEERPVSSAAGGYTASRLVAGSCLALVGDAACSPPPAGQGLNHALEAAAALVDAVAGAAPGAVAEALEGYERARRDDEAAYAFLGAEKGPWQALACAVGRLLGLYPGPAEMKETTAPYRQLTALHRVLGCA